MCWGRKGCVQGFGEETQGKKTTLKTGADGRLILKWIFKK
jgi:hypothetical protein